MARIRTIKPEFFRSHELYQAEVSANRGKRGAYLNIRTAFAGLVTAADREGRFKWRPNELKLDCLPYDEIRFEDVLHALEMNGNPPFVVQYEADGQTFGVIPGFKTHQRPHPQEAPSKIQPPPADFLKVRQSNDDRTTTALQSTLGRSLGKGREGKGTDIPAIAGTHKTKLEPGRPPTPLQAVIRAFKVAKGIPADDAVWDKDNFPLHARAAAKLLRAFNGNDKEAVVYLLGKAQEWNDANLDDWQLAGIAKHAHDDRGKNGQIGSGSADVEPVGKPSEPLGADRLLDRRGPGRITSSRDLANETLRQIGSQLRPVDDGANESQEPDSPVLGPED